MARCSLAPFAAARLIIDIANLYVTDNHVRPQRFRVTDEVMKWGSKVKFMSGRSSMSGVAARLAHIIAEAAELEELINE